MNIQITRKDENKLLDRIEVEYIAIHKNEKTPPREECRAQIAANLQVSKDTVVIDNQKSKFGMNYTTGYAKIYKSKEAAIAMEPDFINKRNGLVEKKEGE